MSYASLHSGQPLTVKRPKHRHRRRWVIGSLLALAVIIVVAVAAALTLQPSQPPLALPARAAAAPTSQLDGTWHVATGSVAGFRVRESVLGFGNEVTGRTTDVTGTAVMTGARVTSATFRVSLDAITVNGKARQPQLIRSLDTPAFPAATVTLTQPVSLPPAFSSGATLTQPTAATLTLNGTTRPVTVTLSARRDGRDIQAAGSLPVAFTDFRIKGPAGYGIFGSLASHGTAEFLLILMPAAVS